MRRNESAPLVTALETWLREEGAKLSRSAEVRKPIDYMLSRRDRFAASLEDGRICLTNNAAERALRGFAITRKNAIFAGSDGGGRAWATIATLLTTAKINGVDPYAWLKLTLERLAAGWPNRDLDALMPFLSFEWSRRG